MSGLEFKIKKAKGQKTQAGTIITYKLKREAILHMN